MNSRRGAILISITPLRPDPRNYNKLEVGDLPRISTRFIRYLMPTTMKFEGI